MERRKGDRHAAGALVLVRVCLVLIVLVGGVGAVLLLEQEKQDTQDARSAAFRICDRGNYTRAELHVAYNGPKVSAEKLRVIARTEPALAALLSAAQENQTTGLRRVQKLNPILKCEPNLYGKAAREQTPAAQRAFVEKYRRLELPPLPTPRPPR